MGPDRDRIVECMLDPVTSGLLAGLEGGPRECADLAREASVTEAEALGRLSYLIEHGLVTRDGGTLEADSEKLASAVGDFGAAIGGLEKMDSYLN